MAESKSKSGAPSFYSAAADMQSGAGAGAPKPPGAPGAGADANPAEEAKIVATLLEVIEKWSQMTKDTKRKDKIQQIATIAKEIQSGMSGAGSDGKGMPSDGAAPAPDAMGAGAGGSGTGAGAGTPTPPPM